MFTLGKVLFGYYLKFYFYPKILKTSLAKMKLLNDILLMSFSKNLLVILYLKLFRQPLSKNLVYILSYKQ